jgi:hypothetical protein
MAELERTTFEVSRASEYFDARQLSALTGVPASAFASVCLKELVDNALDACETAHVAPVVNVEVERDDETIRLTVSDNGPGIPPEVVKKVLNYNIRVSDKAAYRSPTRGAQGNALKTVVGIPYALGGREPLIVAARGVRHSIRPWVDPAGNVHFDYAPTPAVTHGTTVHLTMPADWGEGEVSGKGYYERHELDIDPLHWVRSFAAFNPHATVSYQGKSGGSEEPEIYKSHSEGSSYHGNGGAPKVVEVYKPTLEGPIRKYVPSEPTSPHWYSAASLRGLVFNHIAHARAGGRDLPLGEFVRQFAGLTSTRKAKAVAAPLVDAGFTHLSSFARDEGRVAELLTRMQAESKPPKASALGYVGEEHFRTFFERVYDSLGEFKFVRRSGTMPSGLPFTFEFALAILDEPGHLYCGINFSPTFGDPLEGTTLAGPEFKAGDIKGFLSAAYALPETDSAWYRTPARVAVAAHIITPAPLFLDRGKTRLDMENA